MNQQHTEYHKNGSVWAKGDMADGVPDGYRNGFEKTEKKCVQDISETVNR